MAVLTKRLSSGMQRQESGSNNLNSTQVMHGLPFAWLPIASASDTFHFKSWIIWINWFSKLLSWLLLTNGSLQHPLLMLTGEIMFPLQHAPPITWSTSVSLGRIDRLDLFQGTRYTLVSFIVQNWIFCHKLPINYAFWNTYLFKTFF